MVDVTYLLCSILLTFMASIPLFTKGIYIKCRFSFNKGFDLTGLKSLHNEISAIILVYIPLIWNLSLVNQMLVSKMFQVTELK